MKTIVANDYTFRIRKGYESAVQQAMRETVLQIEQDAKLNVVDNDSVDTGALLNSIYSTTPDKSGYGNAEASASMAAAMPGAHSGKPHEFTMMPEVPVGPMEAAVAVGAEYGVYVEFGTVFIPPAPFFGPADERGIASFEEKTVEMINREVSD